MGRSRKRRAPRRGVAPADLIQEDFAGLKSGVVLRTNLDVEDLLLIQSVEGHAQEGHGAFRGRRFVNMTTAETVRALGRSPRAVAADRQELIDEIRAWADRGMAGEAASRLLDEEGEPLLGVGLFRTCDVKAPDVLRGLYLGGLRDDPEIRLETEKRHGVRMGGGACYLVNVQVMEKMGLDGEALAHGEHGGRIEEYRSRRLIVDEPPDRATEEDVRWLYIRHRRGGGASDDAAMVAAGLLHGLGVGLGCFLADAIDTLEKFVPWERYGDQDSDLARHIERKFGDLGLDLEDVYRLTAISAVPEGQAAEVPDSSLRYLLAVDRKVDQTALESHILFVEGGEYAPMDLAIERAPSERFYRWVREQIGRFAA
jgi:hypothetical protein